MNTSTYLTEAETPFTKTLAIKEAARCLLCHDAPCSAACPAETRPADFIRSVRFDNFHGAAQTIRKSNILGGICARVCPYENLCEKECTSTGIDKPIKIGKLQRFITDFEKDSKLKVLDAPVPIKEKIAVIGSGPAGLACAGELALRGYSVTIFEAKATPGGMLSYGIVPSRLPQEVVDHEIQYIKDLGVAFVMDCKVGKDIVLSELKKQGFSAFLVATGKQLPKRLNIPGDNLKGIKSAIDFLSTAKASSGKIPIGKNIVIIGGGDVAMDSAVTAKLLGAEKVTVLYRRRWEDMPATKAEKKYSKKPWCKFLYDLYSG